MLFAVFLSLACRAFTTSWPTPAETTPARARPRPSRPARPRRGRPPPAAPRPKNEPSDAGSGAAARFLSAARWARCGARARRSPCTRADARGAAALGGGEAALDQLRERELGLLAGEPAFELLAERAAARGRAGSRRRRRTVEDLADLGVRAAFELAHDERGALVEAEEAERADLFRGRDVLVGARTAWVSSSNATSCGRRCESRKRCRQTLCAILISQLCGLGALACGRRDRRRGTWPG